MPPSPSWIICRIPLLKTSHHNLHKVPIFGAISLVSFSTSTPKISIFDYLVNQHQFSPECASKVSSLSSTNYISKPQNTDSFINFLKETGFSRNQIETIVQKEPSLLSANLETSIKPKVKVFQHLGCQSTDLADIVSAYPFLLRSSADRLRLSIEGLKNVLGPHANVFRLLKRSMNGRILGYDLSRTLLPNIEYFKNCGVCSLQIATYVCRYPFFFLTKPDKLEGIVQRVDEMGFDRKSKMFLEAVKVLNSMSRETWELKLQVFRDLGFSENDILIVFRRMPPAFTVSESKIKEVTQLLLSVEDISYIARFPVLLAYSVEKRLNPRLRVLKSLQSENLLKKKPPLAGFLKISDAEFINKYVSAYSNEVSALYVGSQGS